MSDDARNRVVTLSSDDCDEADVRRALTEAVEVLPFWVDPAAGYVPGLDGMVAKAAEVLGMAGALSDYRASCRRDAVDALEVRLGDTEPDSPPARLARLVEARYGRGEHPDPDDLRIAMEGILEWAREERIPARGALRP